MGEVVRAQTDEPNSLLHHAISVGANPETIEKMMHLSERHSANLARQAFDRAMSQAKAEIRPIAKKNAGPSLRGGSGSAYQFESLADIDTHVDPILAAHGLSCRFRSETSDGLVTVWCIISHQDGHFEETSLSGPAETSGSKNAYQAIGSAVTYLQRYTKKLALGLSAAKDDDAGSVGPATLSPDQYVRVRDLAQEVGVPEDKICTSFGVGDLRQIPASYFEACIRRLEASRPKIVADEIPYQGPEK